MSLTGGDGDRESVPPAPPEELDRIEGFVTAWLERQLAENPILVAMERGEPGDRRWYVRLAGEEKDHTTIWLTLGQRALRFEAYMLPAPEENEGDVFEQLLRRNRQMRGMAFAIGDEDGIFIQGELPLAALDERQLDRVVGSVFAYVEQFFRPALRLAFASRFRS